MLLVSLIVLIGSLGFYSGSEFWAASYMQAELLIAFTFGWLYPRNINTQRVFCLLTINSALVLAIDHLIPYVSNAVFMAYCFILLLLGFLLSRSKDTRGDDINLDNVCLVFYRSKSFTQTLLSFVGKPVGSFGMILGNSIFQLRHGKKTVQKLGYNRHDILNKYIVIDTGYPVSQIPNYELDLLLMQKARQPKTLFLRLNCLRSFKGVLSHMKGYEYNGKILPSIYLKEII